jgi:prevent-host-death family protein
MKQVKIAELKDHLSKHLRAAERGVSVEVTDRDRPIARIVPVVASDSTIEVVPATRSFATLRTRRYAPAPVTLSSLTLLLEERGRR